MRLFIAEKPSIAKVIAENIGIKKKNKNFIECNDGSVVTWCYGHMFELAEPDEYTPDTVPLSNKGKNIVSTKVGQSAIDIIPEQVKSPVLTAVFESMLSGIEAKSIEPSTFMDKQKSLVNEEIEKVKAASITVAGKQSTSNKSQNNVSEKYFCKVCGKGLIKRESTKTKGVFWWGCSGFPNCKQMYFDDNGIPNYETKEKNKDEK